jgi:hypothetical protein
MRSLPLLALTLALLLATAFPASAQPSLPPDVVQLANGGMLRGTIVENLPGDHVTIQLATGDVRTFPSAEVQFAGPAASAPGAAQELVPPAPSGALTVPSRGPILAQPGPIPPYGMAPMPSVPSVRIHVDATSPDLTLQQVTGTGTAIVSTGRSFSTVMVDSFAPLCTAPCDILLPAHTYVLGVSQGQGAARRGDHNLFTLDHDLSLEIEYESREGARIAGWITFIVGALAGAGIMLGGIVSSSDFVTYLVAGSVVLGVAEIIGLSLAFLNDHADIQQIDGTVRF